MKMVETTRQVRVDNWGIYFLQRLQLFFSKTDYCDLTLQFEGNVQLKVHRLVMNACTEYFAFLEQTCPALEENTIMMPTDLQADVIVPIVNFMYTGMLEFHPSIFEKLFKAAEIMNIAVLTKLLEAQIQRLKPKPKKEPPQSWGSARKTPKPPPVTTEVPTPSPVRKVPSWRNRKTSSPATHPVSGTFSNTKWNSDPPEKDPLSFHDNTPKPTRFEWPDDDQPPFSLDPSFDDVSLTSKPLWTKEDDQKVAPSFEEARSLAQKSHRPSSKNNSISQDMEEEEQKVNIAHLDETVNISGDNLLKRKADSKMNSSPKRVRITNQEDETIISIKTNNPNDLDHTKIVSEILKKYPDLVKKKKNIKLKITSLKSEAPQVKSQTVKERVKPQVVSPVEKPVPAVPLQKEIKVEPSLQKQNSYRESSVKKERSKVDFRAASDEGPWTCMECLGDGEAPEFVLYYLFRKHMSDLHHMVFDASLCKYCGKKCPTDKAMAYHLYTKHGLRPPSNIKFPKCANCPFIGVTNDKIQEHMKIHGKDEVQCVNCKLGFLTNKDLLNHQSITGHHNRSSGKKNAFPTMSILDCAYCMKKLQSPVSLFTHIRSQHMKEARRDGITSLDEIMDVINEDDSETSEASKANVQIAEKNADIVINRVEMPRNNRQLPPQPLVKEKVNIISNVKVADHQDEIVPTNAENAIERQDIPESEPVAVATTTAAALSNIGGSLAANLGLVDIVVLDDNQQYILQQPQGQSGGAEFILPELTGNEGILQAATAAADLNSTDELVMVLTDHDYQDEQSQGQSDNSNIVVLYSHPVEGQQGQFITSQGNLLVNSQGLIEIRNGAGITTTAGQILVNSDCTTTTQAIDSPIESIELIRKEIEGAVAEQEGEREKIKSVLRKKVLEKEINKIEQEVVETKVSSKNTPNNIVNSLENVARTENEIDTTDSTVQEEPMEVDEIVPHQTENVEHLPLTGQEENQSITNAIQDQKQEAVEVGNDQTNEAEAGQDIPPDLTREAPQYQEEEEEEIIPENRVDSISKEGVSKEPVLDHQISEDDKTPHEVPVDEPMEVDGGGINKRTPLNENVEEESQTDTSQFDTANNSIAETPIAESSQFETENVSITETPVEDSSDPSLHHQHQDSFMNDQEESEELSEQECPHHNMSSSLEDNQDQSIEGDQESLVEHEPLQDIQNDETKIAEKEHEQNVDNDQQQSTENNQEPSIDDDPQPNTVAEEPSITPHLERETENQNVKEPSLDNENEPRSVDNDQNMDNEQNDQNDNVQSNFDDFTDESQQSAIQKVPRDLNKEILDDWDDTDSQQSHSQEQESHEQENHEEVQDEEVHDQAALNAAENVNKLMDDWDEEDEEQCKE